MVKVGVCYQDGCQGEVMLLDILNDPLDASCGIDEDRFPGFIVMNEICIVLDLSKNIIIDCVKLIGHVI